MNSSERRCPKGFATDEEIDALPAWYVRVRHHWFALHLGARVAAEGEDIDLSDLIRGGAELLMWQVENERDETAMRARQKRKTA